MSAVDGLKRMMALTEALRKTVEALKKARFQAVAIGDAAHRAHGSTREAARVELLMSTNEKQRPAILAAAKAQGLLPTQAPPGEMRLRAGDVDIHILEASTPLHRHALIRALPEKVLGVWCLTATPEDLILLRAASDVASDKESVIELFKLRADKLDPDYLKQRAEAAGIFDRVKAAWKTSRG
jgi:hypothetical protein